MNLFEKIEVKVERRDASPPSYKDPPAAQSQAHLQRQQSPPAARPVSLDDLCRDADAAAMTFHLAPGAS